MQRFLVTVFLASYLLCFTPARQLTRIPVLLEHFQEHKAEDATLSFFAFLRIHYVDEVVVDDDYARDQELPLRCSDAQWMVLLLPFEGSTRFIVKESPFLMVSFRPQDDLREHSGWDVDIWHPPKNNG